MKVTPFEDEETGEEYFKEYLEEIDCLELCIGNVTASSTMVITIKDVKCSPDAHTVAECSLPACATSEPPQKQPPTTRSLPTRATPKRVLRA